MRLVTIPISHYCEKARWALDRAGIAYREERHVQGIHRVVIRRAGGHGTSPVLVTPEGVVDGSEAILRWVDARLEPGQRLFPEDDEDVVAYGRWLDEGLGKDARRLIYALLLPHQGTVMGFNNQGVPAWEAGALRVTYPWMKGWLAKQLGIGPTTIADDTPRVLRAFDAVAERLSDGRPHLCGERFTAADLTFASLSAAVTAPPQYGVRLPQPGEIPPGVEAHLRQFREHPAGVYALSLFATER